MKQRSVWLSVPLLASLTAACWLSGCIDNGCQAATTAMEKSIRDVCMEPGYANTPFCTCCVPNGYYSIDDTCECKRLVFDADFCQYDARSTGYPSVRRALEYASDVCRDRQVSVPDVEDAGPTVCHGKRVPEDGTGGTGGADSGGSNGTGGTDAGGSSGSTSGGAGSGG